MKMENNKARSVSSQVNVARIEQIQNLEVEEPKTNPRNVTSEYEEMIRNKIRGAVHPISVTIDTQLSGKFRLFACSLVFVNRDGIRENMVFLERTTLLEFNLEYVIKSIRSYFPDEKLNEQIEVIMVKSEDMFSKTSKQKFSNHQMLCTFSHITKFAEQIMKIEEFFEPIMKVKDLVHAVQTDAVIFLDFERNVKSQNKDLPVYQKNDWMSDVKFLERYLELHETLSYVADMNNLEHINEDELHWLKYLLNILRLLRDMSNNLAQEKSSISDVFAEIMLMKRRLPSPVPVYFEQRISKIFDDTLSILFGSMNNRYSFAALLDPRHAYKTSITTSKSWNSFEKLLGDDLKKMIIEAELDLLPSEANYEVDKEIDIYRKLLIESRPSSSVCPFGWWHSKKNVLPILYKKAIQLLTPTPTTIDVAHFFGPGERYAKICEHWNTDEVRKILISASCYEKFVGRGFNADISQYPFFNSLPEFLPLQPIENGKTTELALVPFRNLKRPNFDKKLLENQTIDDISNPAIPATIASPALKKRKRGPAIQTGRKPCLRSDAMNLRSDAMNLRSSDQTRKGNRQRQSKKIFTL